MSRTMSHIFSVIPAKAGTPLITNIEFSVSGVPAFAGMTGLGFCFLTASHRVFS